MADSLKREFRIDSSDSARPAATLDSEAQHYAQGLKVKPRVITSVDYEELGDTVPRGANQPSAKLILRVTTYDDGMTIDTTVGEDNAGYQDYLKGLTKKTAASKSTRRHVPTKKPAAPSKTTKVKE